MKTRGRKGQVVFIFLSALQIQENKEYRFVFHSSQVFGNPGGTRATSL